MATPMPNMVRTIAAINQCRNRIEIVNCCRSAVILVFFARFSPRLDP
jgi:hypothetical protein